MEKRVAIYVRVSTKDQSVDMQLNDLERYSPEKEVLTCIQGVSKTMVCLAQRKQEPALK